jgi:hypothetical protein
MNQEGHDGGDKTEDAALKGQVKVADHCNQADVAPRCRKANVVRVGKRAEKQNDERADDQDGKPNSAAGEPVVNPSMFGDEPSFDLRHRQERSALLRRAGAACPLT